MRLSIVSTLYCSEAYVSEFCSRIRPLARQLAGDEYEIIFVNDGSPDSSLSIALEEAKKDPQIVVVDLSRNFGHHRAMMAGLECARGDRIFLIDSDLEEEPEWLLRFNDEMNRKDCDVVYGVQDKRKGAVFERWSGAIFYKIFRAITGVNQADNVVTARLMTARYVKSLLGHREREVYICGLWVITGFKQISLSVRKHADSPSTYNIGSKVDLLINAITAFSARPLTFIFYTGACVFFSSLIFIAYLCLKYFLSSSAPSGYTSIIVSIWFFSGLMILFLGIQGIYLSKIFSEVKQRPYVIVRRTYRASPPED